MQPMISSNFKVVKTDRNLIEEISQLILEQVKNTAYLKEISVNPTSGRRKIEKTFLLKDSPTVSLYNYLQRFVVLGSLEDHIMITATVILLRVFKYRRNLNENHLYMLITGAILISFKTLHDSEIFCLKDFSKVSGISVRKL